MLLSVIFLLVFRILNGTGQKKPHDCHLAAKSDAISPFVQRVYTAVYNSNIEINPKYPAELILSSKFSAGYFQFWAFWQVLDQKFGLL